MNDTPLKNKGESKVLSKEIYTLYNEINAARKERGWTYLTDKELNTNNTKLVGLLKSQNNGETNYEELSSIKEIVGMFNSLISKDNWKVVYKDSFPTSSVTSTL